MVKYDPDNPLSDEELDKLSEEDFDKFLEYLDSKTAYLKQFTKPLDAYHLKRFAANTLKTQKGEQLSVEERKLMIDAESSKSFGSLVSNLLFTDMSTLSKTFAGSFLGG